jgi:hypothetical protein
MTYRVMRPLPSFVVYEIALLVLSPFALGENSQEGSQITCVPMAAADNRSVQVMVNGRGPFLFGLDTGASGAAYLDPSLVELLELPVVGELRAGDGSGEGSRQVKVVEVQKLTLGDITFSDLSVPVVQHAQPDPGEGNHHYGTLAFELFKEYLVTFDYPHRELCIATGELPPANGRNILGFFLKDGTPVISCRVGPMAVQALVDSGGGRTLLLPLRMARELPLKDSPVSVGRVRSLFNESEIFEATLDGDLEIGAVRIPSPRPVFSELFAQPVIGRDLIHRFAWTFDQKQNIVRISSPDIDDSSAPF